jgi:uncharacterized protein YbjT (DUF2867 family)
MRPAAPSESGPTDPPGRRGMPPHTALVVGATGLVGRHVVRLLIADGAYERIRVVARRPLPEELAHPKTEPIIFSFEELQGHQSALAGDHVFCALGTTRKAAGSKDRFREVDVEYPRRIAVAARRNGARHFSLVSAVGADRGSRVFYNRMKGEAEAAVRDAGYESGSILRPSMLGGEHEGRPLERLGQLVARWAPGRFRLVDAADVARVMIRLAKEGRPGWTVVESEVIRALAR